MDKTQAIIKLGKYKELLSKEMLFDEMILFGSYAKGNHKEDSDIDVAIIIDFHINNFTALSVENILHVLSPPSGLVKLII